MTNVAAGDFILAEHNADHETRLDNLETNLPVQNYSATSGSTTSTSYTSTLTGVGTALSITFVAPTTSVVVVVGALIMQATSGPWNQYISPHITDGAAFTQVASDATALVAQMTNDTTGTYAEVSQVVTGLTVGTTYTVTPYFKSSNGVSCSFAHRRVLVHL